MLRGFISNPSQQPVCSPLHLSLHSQISHRRSHFWAVLCGARSWDSMFLMGPVQFRIIYGSVISLPALQSQKEHPSRATSVLQLGCTGIPDQEHQKPYLTQPKNLKAVSKETWEESFVFLNFPITFWQTTTMLFMLTAGPLLYCPAVPAASTAGLGCLHCICLYNICSSKHPSGRNLKRDLKVQ